MIPLDNLRVLRRRNIARTRLHKALLLRDGELRIRRAAVNRAVTHIPGLSRRRRSVLDVALLDVVPRDAAALFVFDEFVGGVWGHGDDVPGVQEAGEEAEACGV